MVYFGRIRPALVRVPLHTSDELSITGTGNSVTLTPGTLTVVADPKHLLIHTIDRTKDVIPTTKKFEENMERMFG